MDRTPRPLQSKSPKVDKFKQKCKGAMCLKIYYEFIKCNYQILNRNKNMKTFFSNKYIRDNVDGIIVKV